jgi:hypothetical protein
MSIRQSKSTSISAQSLGALLLALPSLATAEGPAFTAWTEPVHLGDVVNSSSRELTPELSPDGLSLYFISNRPGGFGDGFFDIYVSERDCKTCPWEAPVVLGPHVNSPGDEIAPSFSPDGHLLFFASDRDNEPGDTDIWVSFRWNRRNNFGWGPPIRLGPHVNTPAHETSPALLVAKTFFGLHTLYFVRDDEAGNQDIHETAVTRFGFPLWAAMPVMGINDPVALDGDPSLRGDGLEMILYSGRAGGIGAPGTLDIWSATRPSRHHAWSIPENLGAPVNTRFADFTPSLTLDGLQLYFVSAAARGGLGLQDIWMSTREKIGDND